MSHSPGLVHLGCWAEESLAVPHPQTRRQTGPPNSRAQLTNYSALSRGRRAFTPPPLPISSALSPIRLHWPRRKMLGNYITLTTWFLLLYVRRVCLVTASSTMLRRIATQVPRRAVTVSTPRTHITTCPHAIRLLSTTATRSMPAVSPPLTTSLPSDSFQLLSESKKPGPPEDALYEQQIKDVESWWATPRYAAIKRPYAAADVVSKRGSLQQSYPSSVMARKLWQLIQEKQKTGEPIHTSACPS